MSIWTHLRKAFTPERKSLASPDAALLAAFGLTETTSTGIVVSQAEALKVPVVANAIQLISEAVASLDVTVKRIEGQDEVDVPDHPLLALLRDEANDWTTGFELIRQIVRDALMNDAGGLAWVNRVSRQLCTAVTADLRGEKGRPPEAGLMLWNAFQGISATRTYHPAGPNPIQPSEILAWCQLHRLPLAPHHVDTLLAMDQAWLDHAYAKARAPEGIKALPPVSAHPISAALLDVVMG